MKVLNVDKEEAGAFTAISPAGRNYKSRLEEALMKGAFNIAWFGAETIDMIERACERVKENSPLNKASKKMANAIEFVMGNKTEYRG